MMRFNSSSIRSLIPSFEFRSFYPSPQTTFIEIQPPLANVSLHCPSQASPLPTLHPNSDPHYLVLTPPASPPISRFPQFSEVYDGVLSKVGFTFRLAVIVFTSGLGLLSDTLEIMSISFAKQYIATEFTVS